MTGEDEITPQDRAEQEAWWRHHDEVYEWLCVRADVDPAAAGRDQRGIHEFISTALQAAEHTLDTGETERFDAAQFLLTADVPGQYSKNERVSDDPQSEYRLVELAAGWLDIRKAVADFLIAVQESAMTGDESKMGDPPEPSYRHVHDVERAYQRLGDAVSAWKDGLVAEAGRTGG